MSRRGAPSRAIEDLGRGALARTYGTVDRAVRRRRGFGPGPVHPPEGVPEQRPEATQDPGGQVRHRAATRPFLRPPGSLDEVDTRCRTRPEPRAQSVAGAAAPL